jgi:lycopene cyclase domain-containing protein
MYSYLLISLPFIAISAYFLYKVWSIDKRSLAIVFLIVMSLTVVFDSLIIWAGIVDYDLSKILGIYIAKAPIEDFLYSVFAIATTIFVWEKSKGDSGE